MMTELFNHYEQQFGNISAEITARICKIPNLHGCQFWRSISIDFNLTFSVSFPVLAYSNISNIDKSSILFVAAKKSAVSDVERCFDEARELVRATCFIVSKLIEIQLSHVWIDLDGVCYLVILNGTSFYSVNFVFSDFTLCGTKTSFNFKIPWLQKMTKFASVRFKLVVLQLLSIILKIEYHNDYCKQEENLRKWFEG